MQQMDLLQSMLPVAVPLWILEFKKLSWDEIQKISTDASQFIAEHGDNILFKGPKKGDTAKAFNALAKGVAALSFVPGGVKLFGLHFEAVHPESLEGKGRWLYHSMLADALPLVSRDGLLPAEEGKVFLTGTLDQAGGYVRGLMAQNLEAQGQTWDPVVLRAHSAHLGDVESEPRSFDDWFVTRKISPLFLQVWVPEKKAWLEVREAVAQNYFANWGTKRGEPGKIDVAPDASPGEYARKYLEQFWPEN